MAETIVPNSPPSRKREYRAPFSCDPHSLATSPSKPCTRGPDSTITARDRDGTKCNKLGEAGAGCIPTRPASVDQVHTKNNRHTPVMVYDDLMIIK